MIANRPFLGYYSTIMPSSFKADAGSDLERRSPVGSPTSDQGRNVGVDIIMKGSVYILKDANNKLYIGSTDNIERRLYQHSRGSTHTTHRMDNPALVFSQEFESLKKAREVEKRLKKLKRKDYIEKIISDGYIKVV